MSCKDEGMTPVSVHELKKYNARYEGKDFYKDESDKCVYLGKYRESSREDTIHDSPNTPPKESAFSYISGSHTLETFVIDLIDGGIVEHVYYAPNSKTIHKLLDTYEGLKTMARRGGGKRKSKRSKKSRRQRKTRRSKR